MVVMIQRCVLRSNYFNGATVSGGYNQFPKTRKALSKRKNIMNELLTFPSLAMRRQRTYNKAFKLIRSTVVSRSDTDAVQQGWYFSCDDSIFLSGYRRYERDAAGSSRFPSREWLRQMLERRGTSSMPFAGHICGSWVREILMGRWPYQELTDIHPDFMSPGVFDRFQLNTHAQPHEVDHEGLSDVLTGLSETGHSIIFQYDNVNTRMVDRAIKDGHSNISALFDLSHGAGILPDEWPAPLQIPCGYAGGLSPENVAGQLQKLEPVVGATHIWIDAETHLRSDADRAFDLKKVVKFLEAAEPWLARQGLKEMI